MKKKISILLLGTATFFLMGCGVKGPLYFPEKEKIGQHEPDCESNLYGKNVNKVKCIKTPILSTKQDQ
ncbi:hypothetical protein BKG89_08465 [Rodentibacter caecimuris]|uniref:Lipoprotein n=1 Tax=Rodentibacter caecimuris TaxID=1796644 RepID=A0ABX3KX91_9PAST|nr:hypothetical protein BKG89_08465 [Rodentibacter heylii]